MILKYIITKDELMKKIFLSVTLLSRNVTIKHSNEAKVGQNYI